MKKQLLLFLCMLLLLTGCAGRETRVIEDSESLTWWCPNRYAHVSNMGDSAVYSALMERTGVAVTFVHPPQGEHRERFLSLLSAETLPDIISHDFVSDYPGGPEKALNDGVIIPLNDIIDRYCPNLRAYLNAHPDIEDMISTRDERIFCFPSVQADREIRTYMGPFIRDDLLEAADLGYPVTVADWTAVLTAFKTELGITPLSFYGGKIMDTDFLIGAYGISWDFYVEDGVVKCGPLEDGFEDFAAMLKAWYDEGLIAAGVFSDSQKTYEAKAKRGDIGVYVDYVTSIDSYQSAIDGARFIPLSYPVLAEEEHAFSGHIAPVFVPYASCYLTRDNKDIEAAARLLDYAYSPEGNLLYNFGIAGESYTLSDGQPVYTQAMADDPQGFSAAVKRYLASGAYVRDPVQFSQMLVLDVQRDAVALWSDTRAQEHELPTLVLSADQSETVAAFHDGYNEVMIGWIKDYCLSRPGTATVQALRDTLGDMGVESVLAIYQEVYDETAKSDP